jgi:hypothetical protein
MKATGGLAPQGYLDPCRRSCALQNSCIHPVAPVGTRKVALEGSIKYDALADSECWICWGLSFWTLGAPGVKLQGAL